MDAGVHAVLLTQSVSGHPTCDKLRLRSTFLLFCRSPHERGASSQDTVTAVASGRVSSRVDTPPTPSIVVWMSCWVSSCTPCDSKSREPNVTMRLPGWWHGGVCGCGICVDMVSPDCAAASSSQSDTPLTPDDRVCVHFRRTKSCKVYIVNQGMGRLWWVWLAAAVFTAVIPGPASAFLRRRRWSKSLPFPLLLPGQLRSRSRRGAPLATLEESTPEMACKIAVLSNMDEMLLVGGSAQGSPIHHSTAESCEFTIRSHVKITFPSSNAALKSAVITVGRPGAPQKLALTHGTSVIANPQDTIEFRVSKPFTTRGWALIVSRESSQWKKVHGFALPLNRRQGHTIRTGKLDFADHMNDRTLTRTLTRTEPPVHVPQQSLGNYNVEPDRAQDTGVQTLSADARAKKRPSDCYFWLVYVQCIVVTLLLILIRPFMARLFNGKVVFISYKASQSKATFIMLLPALTFKGYRVFDPITFVNPNSQAMQRQVKKSHAIIAVLSPDYFKSKWCCIEAGQAARSGIPIIPVYDGDKYSLEEVMSWRDIPTLFDPDHVLGNGKPVRTAVYSRNLVRVVDSQGQLTAISKLIRRIEEHCPSLRSRVCDGACWRTSTDHNEKTL